MSAEFPPSKRGATMKLRCLFGHKWNGCSVSAAAKRFTTINTSVQRMSKSAGLRLFSMIFIYAQGAEKRRDAMWLAAELIEAKNSAGENLRYCSRRPTTNKEKLWVGFIIYIPQKKSVRSIIGSLAANVARQHLGSHTAYPRNTP